MLKFGTTRMTKEIRQDATVYCIPHLKIDCPMEILEYLFEEDIVLKKEENKIVCAIYKLKASDVLYFNGLYSMVSKIRARDGRIFLDLIQSIKDDYPEINPYQFVMNLECNTYESMYDSGTMTRKFYDIHDGYDLITTDFERFKDGKLNPNLINDLAEVFNCYLSHVLHRYSDRDKNLLLLGYFINRYPNELELFPPKCIWKCDEQKIYAAPGHGYQPKCHMPERILEINLDILQEYPRLMNLLSDYRENYQTQA